MLKRGEELELKTNLIPFLLLFSISIIILQIFSAYIIISENEKINDNLVFSSRLLLFITL